MYDTHKTKDGRQALADRIIDEALKRFMEQGIRAVKMDNIAKALVISKRTLYEVFSNKEELVIECFKRFQQQRFDDMVRFSEKADNVMEILIYSFRQKVEELRQTNPQFYTDVERYPALCNFFKSKEAENHSMFIQFMKRGVAEGYFFDKLNYEFIAAVLNASNRLIMETQLYKQYSMESMFFNMIFITIRGLCTKKGLDVLDRFYHEYTRERKLGAQH